MDVIGRDDGEDDVLHEDVGKTVLCSELEGMGSARGQFGG